MQLKLESGKGGLVLMVLTGPLESYVPGEEVKALFEETLSITEEIKEYEKQIEPKLIELQKKIYEFNKKLFEEQDQEMVEEP